MKIKSQVKQIIKFCLLPACFIFFLAWVLTKNGSTAFVVSLSTAFMGWTNSIILSSLNFIRSEASKGRDVTAQYIEKLFDEIDELLTDRALKEAKLEMIVAARVSILETRLLHLKKRTNLQLLTDKQLADLRSKPLDCLKSDEYQKYIINLKFEYLDEIEKSYSNWLSNS